MKKLVLQFVAVLYVSASIFGQGGDCAYPIIFVHGLNSSSATWSQSLQQLASVYGTAQNIDFNLNNDPLSTSYTDDVVMITSTFDIEDRCIYTLNFDNQAGTSSQSASNESAIVKQGYAVKIAVDQILQVTGKSKVILVGHSMGGLACRDYIQRWKSPSELTVAKLLTLGTPHLGANIAQFSFPGGPTPFIPDPTSEASRDLAASVWTSLFNAVPGPYLFGGDESQAVYLSQGPAPVAFHNQDVNSNGTLLENIVGINQGTADNPLMPLDNTVKYTYYVSNVNHTFTCVPSTQGYGCLGDGAVDDMQMWLYEGGNGSTYDWLQGTSIPAPNIGTAYRASDRITTQNSVAHLNQTKDFDDIYRGLDEGDFPFYAYEVTLDQKFVGQSARRSDIVAASSNISVPGHPETDDPFVDGDWFKLIVGADTQVPYSLTIQKPQNKYCQIDFFSNSTPDPYFNGLPSSSEISVVSHKNTASSVTVDVGTLLAGTYYFRITTDVDSSEPPLQKYFFEFHPQGTFAIVPEPHRPYLQNGVLDIGLFKVKQGSTPPVYNPSDNTWSMELNVYNGYYTRSFFNDIDYPNCSVNALYAELPPTEADVFESMQALLEHFGETSLYDGTVTVTTDFTTNAGYSISFPEDTKQELIRVVLLPMIDQLAGSVADGLFQNQKVRKYLRDKVLDQIESTVNFVDFQDLVSEENTARLAEKLYSKLSGKIQGEIADIVKAQVEDLVLNPPTELQNLDRFEPDITVDLAAKVLSKATDIVGGRFKEIAVQLAGLGGFIYDLQSNADRSYCFAFDYEDNRPVQTVAPTYGTVSGGIVPLTWGYFDPDGDDLIYDVYVKSPLSPAFERIAHGISSTSIDYTVPASEDGLYEWQVVVRYPYPHLMKVESGIQTFELNCSSYPSLVVDENLLTIIKHPGDPDLYDLSFGFVGVVDAAFDYTAEMSYTRGDESFTQILNDVQPNVSSPSNVFIDIPKDEEITLVLRGGCSIVKSTFSAYPKITHVTSHSTCTSRLVVTEPGAESSYAVYVDDVLAGNVGAAGDEIILSQDQPGSTGHIVKVVPAGSQDTLFSGYTFTCLNNPIECQPEIIATHDPLCDDDLANVTLANPIGYRVELTYNNGDKHILDGDNTSSVFHRSYGSPKQSYVAVNRLLPNCSDFSVIASSCDLSKAFLDQEGLLIRDLMQYAIDCGWSPSNPGSRMASNNSADLPTAVLPHLEDVRIYQGYHHATIGKLLEYYGDLYDNENFVELYNATVAYVEGEQVISSADSIQLLAEMGSFDFEAADISEWIARWNKSVISWAVGILEPTDSLRTIFFKTNIMYHDSVMTSVLNYATSQGHASPQEMFAHALDNIQAYSLEDDPNENAVCASVGITLSQTLTMTREAFEGTLTIFNGSTDGPMDSIELDLLIIDTAGVVSNDLFEIETSELQVMTAIDGTGTLAADQEGSAKIIFIPESGAAPTVPIPYSFGGNLSYIDPFTGTRVTMPLVPVTLTVNPSPDLFLHYFLERDVLGDDAFTVDVEPSIAAKLGLMIENNGFGDAMSVRIESARPQVIDNEKGLVLSMNLIGTRLQGQDINMGLTNIDFGDINPLSTKVGEWLFTSNLLGHFTGYSTNLVHTDSRGNPDLSLISGVELHELIRSVSVYGPLDDGIEDFLVNEVPDANDHPDAIYLTQGNIVYDVAETFTGEFLGEITYPTFTNTLSFSPQDSNWNYIELDDPGEGMYEIVSVTRNADALVLPTQNAWLTHVTIPDTKQPIYEDKFHIVDDVIATGPQSYTVVWSPKDPNPPAVDTITGSPANLSLVPVTHLQIVFSEEIVDSTFSWQDLTLTHSGGVNLLDSTVSIVMLDSVTYEVDISAFTLSSGHYVFTAQAAGITDLTGVPGVSGKSTTWTQSLSGPGILYYSPTLDGQRLSALDSVDVTFNLAIDTSSIGIEDFTILQQGSVLIDTAITLSAIGTDLRTFRLSDLGTVVAQDGSYDMVCDITGISTTTAVSGSTFDTVSFVLDTQGPTILAMSLSTEAGLDQQHRTSTTIVLDEPIMSFDTLAVSLSRDGSMLSGLNYTVTSISDTIIQIRWSSGATYPDGVYQIVVDDSQLTDLAGNPGTGQSSQSWIVNRSPTLQISNLDITPDFGFDPDDELTYNDEFDFSFLLSEPANDVMIFQDDNGTLTQLHTIDSTVVGPLTVAVGLVSGGNTAILVEARDMFGNFVSTTLPLTIDESQLTGTWQAPQDQSLAAHPTVLGFEFLVDVEDVGIPASAISITRDNDVINHGLSISRLSPTSYEIGGFNTIPAFYGSYRVGLDTRLFTKYSSGISGSEVIYLDYVIPDPNMTPVANAGEDIVVTDLGLVQLDGSLSSDPDGDDITYEWSSFDAVQLVDSTSATPSFRATEAHIGEVLTFLLVVRDSTKLSTDLVRVFIELNDIYVSTAVLLEGPYDPITGLMHDSLRRQGRLPVVSPYADTLLYTFGYPVDTVPLSHLDNSVSNEAIVDWVYIEVVNLANGEASTGGNYLLRRDGNVVTPHNMSPPMFYDLPDGEYALRIYHRNHLPIMSDESVVIRVNMVESLDLTNDLAMIKGMQNAVKTLGGRYTMIAGDIDHNGQIQNQDYQLLLPNIGDSGYLDEDLDMNGEVQNTDLQLIVLPNLGRGKQF